MTGSAMPRRATLTSAPTSPAGTSSAASRPFGRTGWLTAALTGAGVGWQQILHTHAGASEQGEPPALLHWARDAALALPSVFLAIVVATLVVERLSAGRRDDALRAAGVAVGAATALGLGAQVHAVLFGAHHAHSGTELPLWLHLLRDSLTSLPVTLGTALLVLAFRRPTLRLPRLRKGVLRRSAPRVAALSLLASPLAALAPATPAVAADAGGPCPTGARQISYDLAAFENVIPINGWGDKIPSGLQYALRDADARNGKDAIVANPNISQPLIIRANVGDCITVSLRNDIVGRRVGIHPDGLVQFDPKTSDGARVGANPDTTAATGQTRTYTWYADHTGEAPLVDLANLNQETRPDKVPDGAATDPAGAEAADPAGAEAADPAGADGPEGADIDPAADPGIPTIELGLYGGIVVSEKGSTWHDPKTGADLLDQSTGRAVQTAWAADIHNAGARDFRSFALVFMDENESIVDRDGLIPTSPTTGLPDPTFGINYRQAPLRNRLRAILDFRAGKKITLPN